MSSFLKANEIQQGDGSTKMAQGHSLNIYPNEKQYPNLNDLVTNGIFQCYNSTNAPVSGWGVLSVLQHGNFQPNYITQIFMPMNTTNVYMRYRNNGNWSSWKQVSGSKVDITGGSLVLSERNAMSGSELQCTSSNSYTVTKNGCGQSTFVLCTGSNYGVYCGIVLGKYNNAPTVQDIVNVGSFTVTATANSNATKTNITVKAPGASWVRFIEVQ